MSTGASTTETAAGGAAGAEGGGETPPPATTARGTATGQPITPPPTTTTTTTPPPTRSSLAADALKGESLNQRLARERAAADKKWAEGLGFKTVDEAKSFIDKARELEAKEKEKKLADLSELDRAKAMIAERDQELERVKAENEQAQTRVLVERQDRVTREIASQFVKPKALNYAAFEFKTYLKTLTDQEVERLKEKDLRKFFGDFVKDNPEYALGAAETTTQTPTPKPAARAGAPARRPISNGAPPAKRDPARPAPPNQPGTNGGKTVIPGQKNSMNPAEVRAYAAQHGIDYPGPGVSNRNRGR